MLAFDIIRADWCDALHDRAFRRGLILLSAGERTVRFYPRYDTEPSAIDEAISILRRAIEDLFVHVSRPSPAPATSDGQPEAGAATSPAAGVKTRVGTLAIPLDTIDTVDLAPATFDTYRRQILTVEQERYGQAGPDQAGADIPHGGRRPPLQFAVETLEATMANPRAIGIAVRDRVSGRLVAYAIGSAIENHDEEGVTSDPHFGENNTFYLQATATLPSVQNTVEIENFLLDALRERALAAGFEFLSTLIEERLLETGPAWFRKAAVIERFDDYLASGIPFAYLHVALKPVEPEPT
jgi:hypothetical protein